VFVEQWALRRLAFPNFGISDMTQWRFSGRSLQHRQTIAAALTTLEG